MKVHVKCSRCNAHAIKNTLNKYSRHERSERMQINGATNEIGNENEVTNAVYFLNN